MVTSSSPPAGERVWKFAIPQPDERNRSFVEGVPEGAKLLNVAFQHDTMMLWALVNPEREAGPRRLIVVNTGDPVDMPEGASLIGSVTHPTFGVVWHVFDGDAERALAAEVREKTLRGALQEIIDLLRIPRAGHPARFDDIDSVARAALSLEHPETEGGDS